MRLVLLVLPPLLLTSCVPESAPYLELFGAYFPDWLLYGVLGVILSIIARVAMIKTQLHLLLPYQLFVCSSLGFGVAALLWLI